MNFCWSFLRISAILLMTTHCIGQSKMIKDDFSEHGLSIILSDDPVFGNELQKLGFSAFPSPYSVIVRNTSQRGIVAFGIRFTKRFADGHIATSDVASSQPSALLDPGRPSRNGKPYKALIMPGTARLVTPESGIVDPSPQTTAAYTSYQTTLTWTITKVELDSAVFDDGEAIGADQLEVVKRLKARVDAQQDLMEEISSGLSPGEPLRNVLQELRKSGVSTPEPAAVTQLDPARVYQSARQQYLDELTTTDLNFGEEVATRRLQQLKFAARPIIHQKMGGH